MAFQRRQYGACWKFANDALNEQPDNADALYMAGCASREVGNLGVALVLFRRALAILPSHPNLWMHFASTLHDLNEWDEARDAYRMILKASPNDAMATANVAAGYVQQGKLREALEWSERAIELQPNIHIGHIARGFANLGLGRWRAGWEDAEYLYGHHLMTRVYNTRDKEEPAWDGSKGKTVVLQMDQGIGDHIMFAGCIAEMIADCKQVIIECEHRMENLWKRNFPQAIVYPTLGEVEADWPQKHQIDAHISVSWLGRYYRNRDADFHRNPYLTPNAETVAAVRAHLEQYPRPWLGIAWQGGLARSGKHFRSFALAELEPVMRYGGTVFDLSYHDSAKEVANWNVEHPDAQVTSPHIVTSDFDNTVAFAAVMDDIVTCTTTLAHVCGALGRHAYVLTPQAPQWRYQHPAGDGLFWYPEHSVELIRQAPGEIGWSHAIARLAKKMSRIAQVRQAA